MTERDTHFQGFAELLVLEIDGLAMRYRNWPDWKELDGLVKQIIARRAYDLVEHILGSVDQYQPVEDVRWDAIPDLTQWPDSQAPE